jgi:hypothetical protein
MFAAREAPVGTDLAARIASCPSHRLFEALAEVGSGDGKEIAFPRRQNIAYYDL